MGKRVGIHEAVKLTGLTEYNLRTGVLSGKYPAFRVNADKGKILFDMDLLEEAIKTEALANMEKKKKPVDG